ncbi:urea transporter [Corynebacterium ureicelerivorans]
MCVLPRVLSNLPRAERAERVAGRLRDGAEQLAFAAALHVDGTSRGLMGYNGALVGAAAAASGAPLHIATALTVAGAAAVIPMQQVFDRVPRIPAVTAPFCIVAGLLFGPLGNLWETTSPVSSSQLSTRLTSGLFDGFSEVVLADGIVPGLIILAALCVASVQVGGFALLGSALGLALAWAVHADVETVSTGMFNYSAVLTAIAVGTVLWPRQLGGASCWSCSGRGAHPVYPMGDVGPARPHVHVAVCHHRVDFRAASYPRRGQAGIARTRLTAA